jgi:hypothetical protein
MELIGASMHCFGGIRAMTTIGTTTAPR